jgi:hypothetical protein
MFVLFAAKRKFPEGLLVMATPVYEALLAELSTTIVA